MRSRLLVLGLLLLLIPIVSAQGIELQVQPINNEITWDGTATYNLIVRNMQTHGDVIRLRPATFQWDIVFDQQGFAVPGNGYEQVSVTVKPPRDVRMGTYLLEVVAISDTTPTLQSSNFLKVIVANELPKVEPEWCIPKQYVPGPTKCSMIFKNTGSTDVSGITARLHSALLAEAVDIKIGSLAKGEAREIIETTLEVPSNAKVGPAVFMMDIYRDGELVQTHDYEVEILPNPAVDADVVEESGFLSKKFTVTLTNVGNVHASDVYEASVPTWQRLFLYSNKQHDFVTGAVAGTVSAAWPYNLAREESTTVVYTVSFVPILALLLALLIVMYSTAWYLKQDLSITKEIVGADKSLKVKLTVKNGSQRPKHNVLVIDEVPTPLRLTKDFATAVPKALKKVGGSMQLVWKFDTVWPGEEKILAYGFKSTLPLMGQVVLPSARIKTKTEDNRAKIYISNQVSVPGRVEVIEDEPKPSE